jgi:peptidyl-prolyl cis-trans isomerase B (cyclophilin B)
MLATWNDGTPSSNGSQFFIVYQDSVMNPSYTVFGTVQSGLEVVDKVAKGGQDGAFDQPDPSTGAAGIGGGHPKLATKITSLTITDTAPASPASPTGSATPTAPASSAAASPTASTKS